MKVVMKNFIIYSYVEIALAIIGLTLFFLFAKLPFFKGIGLGLIMQASLMLTLAYFAEKRGAEYLKFLRMVCK